MRIETRIIQPSVAGASISGSGSAGQVAYWSGASALTGNANYAYTAPVSGSATVLSVGHGDNAASSDAVIRALVAGTSGGDPFLHLNITGGTGWHVGVDNSDSDRLKVGTGGAVGTTTLFRMFTDGTASFYGPLITYNTGGAAGQLTDFYAGSSGGNDGGIRIYGGNGSGAYVAIYAGSHATNPSVIDFGGYGRIDATGNMRLGTTGILSGDNEKFSMRFIPSSGMAAQVNYGLYCQYINNNDTIFSSTQRGMTVDWRRNITTSITDTGSALGAASMGISFTCTGGGTTYTLANTMAVLTIGQPTISGGGSVSINTFAGINIAASSTNVGARKVALLIGAQSASTNNALIADSASFTAGNWGIILSSANANALAGNLYIGGTAAHSFNVETLSVQAAPTGDANNRALIAGLLTPTGNTAFTGSDVHAVVGAINRTITSSTTDTVGRYASILARMIWSVSGGQTITHTQTGGVNYFSTSGFPAVTGTCAITHFAGYNMPAISTVTGTNFYGVRIQGITGANTSNYAYYAGDISGATNNYAFYSGTGQVSFGDLLELRANHDPGAPTDAIRLSAKDTTEGSPARTLHLRTESAAEATGTFTQTHRVRIWHNNVEYWIGLDAV